MRLVGSRLAITLVLTVASCAPAEERAEPEAATVPHLEVAPDTMLLPPPDTLELEEPFDTTARTDIGAVEAPIQPPNR